MSRLWKWLLRRCGSILALEHPIDGLISDCVLEFLSTLR